MMAQTPFFGRRGMTLTTDQPFYQAGTLRTARFLLSIYIHAFLAGLLIIFALADLFRISPYIKVPGAALVLLLSMISFSKVIRSWLVFLRILIELAAIVTASV